MWPKDEPKAPSLPAPTKSAPVSTASQNPFDQAKPTTLPTSSVLEGQLTRSLVVEGEISGQDDLVIDGEVRGRIRLQGGKLTVGPDGRVTADIEAPEIVVRGEVSGNIKGHDRVRILATAKVKGEVRTRLISIEEGAVVHGLRVNLDQEERHRPVVSPAANSQTDSKTLDSKIPDSKTQVPTSEELSQVHV
jgi:cytoskeletal protein CcmA (bactofilin family)